VTRLSGDRWVLPLKRASGAPAIRLICFPYAGGSPDLFRSWAGALDDRVELLAVTLPGRGRRIREPLYQDWETLLADTFAALCPYLQEPHAFYGHSFGGRLAYELAHLTAVRHPGRTRRLFVSGCRSPDVPQARPYLHQLSETAFRDALREMGGTPAEVLDDRVMMRLLLPTVRSDIRLAELWEDRHRKGVDVVLTAMYGREDRIDDRASMEGWRLFTSRECELIEMPGGHFFLETHRRDLLNVINERLGVQDG
jgi:medium-chain acyl-[acyl-carrier-protein] hydrolase